MLKNSLDTIYFEGDTLKVKEGFYLEKDGPRRTEGINNLVYTSLGLVLFNAKNQEKENYLDYYFVDIDF
ncbi:hypothetical protein [Indibacter alkaliphilus]|nr:hypothetical protein [Indibacter alkaliphilus]